MAYNPSIKDLTEIQFTLPYSTFTIQSFDTATQTFKDVLPIADFDTFCVENPNHQLECDIHIFRTVHPYSYQLFLISYQAAPTFDTKNAWFGFDVLNRTAVPS